ncbi:MAG: hypothetical protein ABI704_00580 [Kofleriaceae bacterium]
MSTVGSWNFFARDFLVGPGVSAHALERLRDLRVAMVAIVALAVVVGRAYARQSRLLRILRDGRVRWIAILFAGFALAVAFNLGEPGVDFHRMPGLSYRPGIFECVGRCVRLLSLGVRRWA